MSTGNCRCTVARAFVGPNLRRAGFEANDAGIRIRVRETVSGVPVLRRPILFRMVCVRPSYSEESGPFLPRDRDRIDSHISGLVFLNRVCIQICLEHLVRNDDFLGSFDLYVREAGLADLGQVIFLLDGACDSAGIHRGIVDKFFREDSL